MVAPTFGTEVGHGDEPGAVPGGSVDDGIHGAVRDRSQMPSCGVPVTLAEGIPLPSVRAPRPLAIPP